MKNNTEILLSDLRPNEYFRKSSGGKIYKRLPNNKKGQIRFCSAATNCPQIASKDITVLFYNVQFIGVNKRKIALSQ